VDLRPDLVPDLKSERMEVADVIEIFSGPAGLCLGHRHRYDGGGGAGDLQSAHIIDSFYPGASAEAVENTVTQIIEQKMTGFDKLLYLSGTSNSAGASRIELTFTPGTDPDLAWAKVQNKLQLAMANLDGSMNQHDLVDYCQSNLEKVLARVPGVGEVETFGTQYSMRVWLYPDKLTDYHLTIEDVIMVLRAYNVEVSAGQFGGAPAMEGQRLNASIIVQHLLKTPDEFAAIPIRTNPDGSIVRIRDVGRTENR